MQDFSSGVRIGSRQQDVDLEFGMTMCTSSSLSVANGSITGGVGKLLLVPLSLGTSHGTDQVRSVPG